MPDGGVTAGIEDALVAVVPPDAVAAVAQLAENLEDLTRPLGLADAVPCHDDEVAALVVFFLVLGDIGPLLLAVEGDSG